MEYQTFIDPLKPKSGDLVTIEYSKTQNMYRYGFYQFRHPALELSFILSFILGLAVYIR